MGGDPSAAACKLPKPHTTHAHIHRQSSLDAASYLSHILTRSDSGRWRKKQVCPSNLSRSRSGRPESTALLLTSHPLHLEMAPRKNGPVPGKHAHEDLVLDFASGTDFTRLPLERRRAAATPSGRVPKDPPQCDDHTDTLSFPAPIVLPDDALDLEPDSARQSLRSWVQEKERNPVTPRRNVLYVASPPEVTDDVSPMRDWARPAVRGARAKDAIPPLTEDIRAYLAAFYHGLEVRAFDRRFRWMSWDGNEVKGKAWKPNYVGLASDDSCVRVHCRENGAGDGLLHRQLDLNDILEGLMEVVPEDAYAIILVVNHDIYEDEDDDFCAGRAFGGSRIAVVSTFRYNPAIEGLFGTLDPTHIWPASHCEDYVSSLHAQRSDQKCPSTPTTSSSAPGAMPAAVRAASGCAGTTGLWLSRVCKTASHELGHCFALDHCVYYSCVMQATASMEEDDRQPPFLCPVCLPKLAGAVLMSKPGTNKAAERSYVVARYENLRRFCLARPDVAILSGFGAWLGERINSLEEAR